MQVLLPARPVLLPASSSFKQSILSLAVLSAPLPCSPVGYYCTGGTADKTPCPAGTANPLLGAKTDTACVACSVTTYTSRAGAAYCTELATNATCAINTVWDDAAWACVACPAGSTRASGATSCTDCPIGQYSSAGGNCTDCPAGQFNPTPGLADQFVAGGNANNCLVCPEGSLPLKDGQSADSIATLTAAATTCDPCPAGKIGPARGAANAAGPTGVCTACEASYYRSGDAAPENNECKKVPAGYKANLAAAATEITACTKGSVSYWTDAGARVPTNSTNCQLCSAEGGNTYAPRDGMAACLPCKGGAVPNGATDACTDCSAGKVRSFYTASNTCTDCLAGYEAGPSGHQTCTQCRPGTYSTAAVDYCSECPRYTYRPTPGATAACTPCPKGYDTQDTGNTECTPCAVGYFKATNALESCTAAPFGTFVNTSAAFSYTPCAVGTFNGKTAQDSCDPCPPGQYANTLGSKSCKTCPAGTFSAGQSATCKACSAGFYAPAGSAACSPCKPGFYAPAARAGTCSLCPKGNQCPSPATSAPKACSLGYFSAKDGQKLCTPCPVNYYRDGSVAATQCKPCAAGSNTRGLTGQSKCQVVRPTSLRRSA